MTISQHPTDQLIRELIDRERLATESEIAAIVARMVSAPFEPRTIAVPTDLQGVTYLTQTLDRRAPSLDIHLAKRVVSERQWTYGTTVVQYLADLRRAIQLPSARLLAYVRRGGYIAGVIVPTASVLTPTQLGLGALPFLLVIYSVDRGIIVSGYQIFALGQAGIPREARWLNGQ
ncbi:MAG: hypothetical protein AVDCRST_MAG18-2375 [uncultured Thermomicrobiales bacterium]|uniref:Uncharacterized protein n=1 Tax=uncultured Thermomicrobiales bacterium TaxID=1645740 RepID=A0A6J4VEY2_9BACT|nr:MAG: hypothetical protein AVDCRST_MAG18-2375 [uncultured Thermomicrobiales bacterium]